MLPWICGARFLATGMRIALERLAVLIRFRYYYNLIPICCNKNILRNSKGMYISTQHYVADGHLADTLALDSESVCIGISG